MRIAVILLFILLLTPVPPAVAQGISSSVSLDPDMPKNEFELRLAPLTKDELAETVVGWRDMIKSTTQKMVDLQVALASAEGEAAENIRAKLVDLHVERKKMLERFDMSVRSWEMKGAEKEAVQEFRAYKTSLMLEEAQGQSLSLLMSRAGNWLIRPDGGLGIAIRLGVILASLMGLFILARVVRNVTSRTFSRFENISKLLRSFLVVLCYWLTIAIGLMIVLSALGVNVAPIFALMGAASFILAFALQDTLGNLAAGLMIMVNRPFDEGDYVQVAGVEGTVKHVSITSTRIATGDNQQIVIPNSKVWGDIIVNVNSSETRRVDLTFGVSYDDSVEQVLSVLSQVVKAHPLVLPEPAPVIRLNALAESAIEFVCRPWVKADDYWTVYWDLTRQVKERFDKERITIPYPLHEVRVTSDPASLPNVTQDRPVISNA